jgi:GNAT superfamily N-acetyltransferase
MIRPLATGDRAALLALLDRCSAESLYQRFLTHSPTAGPRHVDSLFADPMSYTAVVELPIPIGFGTLFFADHGVAEVALLVADGFQGKGIGTTLADHLYGYAATQGVRRLELTVLADNHRIVKLFRRCAPTIEFEHAEAGTLTATIRVAQPAHALAAA